MSLLSTPSTSASPDHSNDSPEARRRCTGCGAAQHHASNGRCAYCHAPRSVDAEAPTTSRTRIHLKPLEIGLVLAHALRWLRRTLHFRPLKLATTREMFRFQPLYVRNTAWTGRPVRRDLHRIRIRSPFLR